MARGARLAWIGALGVVGGATVWACLPDLTPNLCGNGRIDADETCDPGGGGNTNAGCSSTCAILCDLGAFGDAGPVARVLDTSSNHCYFTYKKPLTHDDAQYRCALQNGHLVTFVDNEEVGDVFGNGSTIPPSWPKDARYWIGLEAVSPGSSYFSAASFEPGWPAVGATCSGCFAKGVARGALEAVDGGPGAGPSTCAVGVNVALDDGTTAVTGAKATAQVLCEREPPGSRSTPCFGGAFCFGIAATTQYRYLYNPTRMTAANAETFCSRINGDAGRPSSLVVFESGAQREQVEYELRQTRLVQVDGGTTPTPPEFWIGLASRLSRGDGGTTKIEWVWDDGVVAAPTSSGSRPSAWGNDQPPGNAKANVRAYIVNQDSYDTGLAYAKNPVAGSADLYPFVCRY